LRELPGHFLDGLFLGEADPDHQVEIALGEGRNSDS